MKKHVLTVLFVLLAAAAYCQKIGKKTSWVSEKGFWMVESNVKTPRSSTIYFFNNDKVLVYKEKVEGMRVKINRQRVRMSLKKILEASVVAWEQHPVSKENELLVATALRR
jgi:hypothetical protein